MAHGPMSGMKITGKVDTRNVGREKKRGSVVDVSILQVVIAIQPKYMKSKQRMAELAKILHLDTQRTRLQVMALLALFIKPKW